MSGEIRLTAPRQRKEPSAMVQLQVFVQKRGTIQFTGILVLVFGLLFFTVTHSSAQYSGLSFGYDRAIQFVDPTGLNQVPFWVNQNTATVDFTLYRLTPPDFVKRYAAQHPWQPQTIDTTGLPQVI